MARAYHGAQVGFDTQCPPELSHDIPPLASHLVEIHGLGDSKDIDSSNLGDSRIQRKFVSHLWPTQLSESLPWKICRKYHFRRPAHINVLESHVCRSLLLHVRGWSFCRIPWLFWERGLRVVAVASL